MAAVLKAPPAPSRKALLDTLVPVCERAVRAMSLPAHIDRTEALSVAFLGVAEAFEKYEVSRGRLEAWAYVTAQRSVVSFLDENRGPVRVPARTQRHRRQHGRPAHQVAMSMDEIDVASLAPSPLAVLLAAEGER